MSARRDSQKYDDPAAVVRLPVTLADLLDDALARALGGQPGPCLWCGAATVAVQCADPRSGAVVAACGACGSEISGVAAASLREAAG